MILAALRLFRYDLPLKRPLIIKHHPIRHRSGLLVKLSDEQGNEGFGEIAPLPGLHVENLDLALAEIQTCARSLTGWEIAFPDRPKTGSWEYPPAMKLVSPSVRFGLDMAVLNLWAAAMKVTVSRLLNPEPLLKIPVNALITRECPEVVREVRLLKEQGFRTIKMKVGGRPIPDEGERVSILLREAGEEVAVRLDANRDWSLSEALQFAASLTTGRLEYIEEPVNDPQMITEFYQRSGIGVALDESLPVWISPEVVWPDGVKALVIKPSVMGRLQRTITLIRQALQTGISPVLSAVFESGVGLSFLAQLSAALTPPGMAMGLDTAKWLKEDLLTAAFKVENGEIDLSRISDRPPQIDFRRLKEIKINF